MKKRVLINSTIIFIVFFLATIVGVAYDLLIILNSLIVSMVLIAFAAVIIIVAFAQMDYKEVIKKYYYLEELQEESYKCNFSGESYEEKVEEILEIDSKIKMVANNFVLDADDYLECKFYKKFLPKIIYQSNQKHLKEMKEKTIKIIREQG